MHKEMERAGISLRKWAGRGFSLRKRAGTALAKGNGKSGFQPEEMGRHGFSLRKWEGHGFSRAAEM